MSDSIPRQMSDSGLVERARAGDGQAWTVLFERHRQAAFGVAYRMTGDADLAEDLMQDSFLRAVQALSALRDGGAFHTWLLRITVRLCLNAPRQRLAQVDCAPEPATSETPETLVLQAERSRQIETILRRLPPHHRLLLILRDVEDLSYREIAEVLGCSVNAVKVRLSRARGIFRRHAGHLLSQEVDVP